MRKYSRSVIYIIYIYIYLSIYLSIYLYKAKTKAKTKASERVCRRRLLSLFVEREWSGGAVVCEVVIVSARRARLHTRHNTRQGDTKSSSSCWASASSASSRPAQVHNPNQAPCTCTDEKDTSGIYIYIYMDDALACRDDDINVVWMQEILCLLRRKAKLNK